MPGHRLIQAHLDALATRLPADLAEELADGLLETYACHLARCADADTAATVALAEFGDPVQITQAFADASPGRRTARVLLASGPLIGGMWGAALLTGRAWRWPIPVPARFLFAAALATVLLALIAAARGRAHYQRNRLAAAGGGAGLIVLDTAMLTAAALTAPTLTPLVAVAAAASITRITYTMRAIPAVFTAKASPARRDPAPPSTGSTGSRTAFPR